MCNWQGYSRLQTCHLSGISLCCVREDRCWVAGGAKHTYYDSGLTVKPYMVNKHAHREDAGGRDAYTTADFTAVGMCMQPYHGWFEIHVKRNEGALSVPA